MGLTIPQDVNIETSGKIADKVYYTVDKQKRVRSYVIPIQPGTGPQRLWWAQFRRFSLRYQGFNDAQKAPWNTLGDIFRMTGYNKYISVNLKLVA